MGEGFVRDESFDMHLSEFVETSLEAKNSKADVGNRDIASKPLPDFL